MNSTIPAHGYSQERSDQAQMLMRLPIGLRQEIAKALTQPIVYSGEAFDRQQHIAYLLTDYDRSRQPTAIDISNPLMGVFPGAFGQ